jgi:transposase
VTFIEVCAKFPGMTKRKSARRDFDLLEERRLLAAKLLEKGLPQAEVARCVGVHRQSVSRWSAMLQGAGVTGLKKAGRAGRKPRLGSQELAALEEGLKAGPQAFGYPTALWTSGRVARLIEQQTGIRYHPDHVCRILAKLRWSCQRPVGRALERDEKKIQNWKKKRWPAIKKKPPAKAAPSSSLMKAA